MSIEIFQLLYTRIQAQIQHNISRYKMAYGPIFLVCVWLCVMKIEFDTIKFGRNDLIKSELDLNWFMFGQV